MPTYEFRCPDGHDFERFFRNMSTAPSEVPCPTCGKIGKRHLSAGAGLVFKGSGFYLTDYGKNAHRNSGSPSHNKDSGSASGESGKSENGASGNSTAAGSDSAPAASAKPESGAAKASEGKTTAAAKPPGKTDS